ncbi:UvrD-helicase domain-containing protein [Microbulbifer bruguierae]|uniref:DNA 3'-5' helicase n=1 Tax=Microbulbifer bruguierae TaxID=3029061 RepID=A0ABY8NCY0_9GAMM|nr:UvrD-helicase domain-containing protein [Microbulbifer bruguierae]WGL16269.1 UvrD-helicase domain-containing protein [Microbulbifer bruguierae]
MSSTIAPNIEFISAGAGSGKTYTLTKRMGELLSGNVVQPRGVMATTFTKMAASELKERVRQSLLESGNNATANAMGQAMIGTVNSVCGALVERFAFEAGLSPKQTVIEEEGAAQLFNQALDETLETDIRIIGKMHALSDRLGLVDSKTNQPLWRGEIQKIVDAARSNNLGPEDLRAAIDNSRDSLFSYFPPPTKRNLDNELLDAIDSATSQFNPTVDKTKGSKKYFADLEIIHRSLAEGRLSWPGWLRLSKDLPTAKSRPLAESVQMIASDYDKHPRLREDIGEFIHQIYTIAADSLDTYRRLKTRLGVVDFVDQEQCLLQILELPEVTDALRQELQLLMVDEFQDTSPIQLAIFIKLSELADRAIWVGDIKQSIYGFRGSDPSLMLTVIDHLKNQGATIDVLGKSWRSRPELVEYINGLFVPAFANTIPEQQVALEPAHQPQLKTPAVEHWQLEGSNKKNQYSALAAAVQKLVESGQQVLDSRTGDPRAVTYGDIAILARSNSNLASMAQELSAFGIPVSLSRAGLMATPEAVFAVACLRRLANPADTLASAEIRAMSQGEAVEEWLADRINRVQSDEGLHEWGEDTVPALAAIAEQRQRLLYLSPVEALEQVLLVTDARALATRWSKTLLHAELRLKNLEALLALSENYLDHCQTQNRAATVPGLILWFQQLQKNEQDNQATPDKGAVTLLTHHRAKGLEWPVVIASDLSAPVRPRIWGLRVQPNAAGFDFNAPLAGRSLCYWPSFFGGQSKDVSLKATVESGADGKQALADATEEDKRLLYVSLTRARDHLVLVSTQKSPTKSDYGYWWDCVDTRLLLPESDSVTLPKGKTVATKFASQPEAESPFIPTQEPLHWLGAGRKVQTATYFPRYLTPSAAEPLAQASIGDSLQIGERIALHNGPDITRLGEAVHAVIASAVTCGATSVEMTERVLADYGMREFITVPEVDAMVAKFLARIQEQFQPEQCWAEVPIQYTNSDGQQLQGFIDLLLETEQGWIVIDHKSSPRARSEWEPEALKYSGQLDVYRQALLAATEKPVLGCWIHFAITGGLVEVKLPQAAKATM